MQKTQKQQKNKKVKPQIQNSIFTLTPFKYHGTWVFDDESVGLNKEAFVCGVPEIIEDMLKTAKIPLATAQKGFRLLFSVNDFPGSMLAFKHDGRESSGNWYITTNRKNGNLQLRGWLCPALFKYFPEAPETLYAKVERLDK